MSPAGLAPAPPRRLSDVPRLAVFGYGSLVSPASAAQTLGRAVPDPVPARLAGWRRRWSTGRDNRRVEKRFARADDGRVLDWCLGLNVEPAPGGGAGSTGGGEAPGEAAEAPNGALLEVSAAELRRLELRELRYRPVDVTASLDPGVAEPFDTVFAFAARPEHHHPVPPDGAVVIAAYVRAVEAAFAALGPRELDQFRATTGPPPVEVVEAVLVADRIPAGNPREW